MNCALRLQQQNVEWMSLSNGGAKPRNTKAFYAMSWTGWQDWRILSTNFCFWRISMPGRTVTNANR